MRNVYNLDKSVANIKTLLRTCFQNRSIVQSMVKRSINHKISIRSGYTTIKISHEKYWQSCFKN